MTFEDFKKFSLHTHEPTTALPYTTPVEVKKEEKMVPVSLLETAFHAGYWLHLDKDNNDFETRKERFKKWFNENIK